IDTAALEHELAWRPKYGSEAAFADFAAAQGLGHGHGRLTNLLGRT
ncbi:NAD-dependent dehydratase, partial [Micromonospora aurantiaca]|nr:NAD-dependent dehydratase [Micromonospora aurantiaca]